MGGWRDQRRLKKWLLAQIAVVLAFLPWVPVLLHHFGAYRGVDFSSWPEYLAIMKTPFLELAAFGGTPRVEITAAVAFVLLILFGFLPRSSRRLQTAAFWLAWIVIPVVAHRYTGTLVIRTRAFIFLVPAMAVLVSLPVTDWLKEGRRGRALAAGMLYMVFLAANLTAIVQTWQRTRVERSLHPSLTQMCDVLRKEAGPRSALVLNRGKAISLVNLYLDPQVPTIGFWAYPGEDRNARVMDSMARLSELYDEFWLVTTRGKGQAPWNDLVPARAPDAPRFESQDLAIQRVSSGIFRRTCTERNDAGWRTGDGVLSRVVLLDEEGASDIHLEAVEATRVRLDVLAKFPDRRPFYGVLEMGVNGRRVAAEKIGSDFAGLYRLEADLEPGSHELSVRVRDPKP